MATWKTITLGGTKKCRHNTCSRFTPHLLGGTNKNITTGSRVTNKRKVEAMDKQVDVSTEKLEVMRAIEEANDTQVKMVSAFIAGIKVNLTTDKEEKTA